MPLVLPSITVGCIDVYAEVQQELNDVMVPRAHSVMEWSDALIVGCAWITHLCGKKDLEI